MCKNTLSKHLAELNALLVEAVDIPEEALEHNLILEMREQCTKSLRSELVTNNNA